MKKLKFSYNSQNNTVTYQGQTFTAIDYAHISDDGETYQAAIKSPCGYDGVLCLLGCYQPRPKRRA